MHRRRRYWVQGGIDCLYDAENVAIDLFKRAKDYEVFYVFYQFARFTLTLGLSLIA